MKSKGHRTIWRLSCFKMEEFTRSPPTSGPLAACSSRWFRVSPPATQVHSKPWFKWSRRTPCPNWRSWVQSSTIWFRSCWRRTPCKDPVGKSWKRIPCGMCPSPSTSLKRGMLFTLNNRNLSNMLGNAASWISNNSISRGSKPTTSLQPSTSCELALMLHVTSPNLLTMRVSMMISKSQAESLQQSSIKGLMLSCKVKMSSWILVISRSHHSRSRNLIYPIRQAQE